MTVRIIDETPDPIVVKRTTCKQCGVRLEYVPIDVQTYTTTDYTGGCDTYRYIPCPKCSTKVHVAP